MLVTIETSREKGDVSSFVRRVSNAVLLPC